MPKRANLKGPGKCIFCGGPGLTKEHIWPQWSYKYVPKSTNTNHLRGVTVSSPSTLQLNNGSKVKRHNGAVNTIQIRVVCKSRCNNGWMSTLEESVKPILVPLMLGQSNILDPKQQQILAAWYTLKVMVAEFSAPDDVASSQAERDLLMSMQQPPPGWQVWIARQQSPNWRTKYNRYSATLALRYADGEPITTFGKLSKNAKAVTMGIGELLLYAIATPSGLGVQMDENLARPLRRVWPPSGAVIWPPSMILTDQGCDAIARSLERFAATLPWTEGPG